MASGIDNLEKSLITPMLPRKSQRGHLACLPSCSAGGMDVGQEDGIGAVFPRYVCIAMEALDQLLMACHCQSINLFVESFLKMVAKLLESEKPNLQILGTNSVRSCPRGSGGGSGCGGGWDLWVSVRIHSYLLSDPKYRSVIVLTFPFV